MQHITYTEYLPLVLDPAHLAPLAGLLQYDPQVDARIFKCLLYQRVGSQPFNIGCLWV